MGSSPFIVMLKAMCGAKMPDLPEIDLHGKVAIVTGASAGIGIETCIGLTKYKLSHLFSQNRLGCHVILACRNVSKAQGILQRINQEVPNANCEVMRLDLASFRSIREFSEEFKSKDYPLHYLINNAGVFQPLREETEDGHEAHFGVNHLGHFLLTNLLLEVLKRSAPSKVINLSSEGHRIMEVDFEDLESTNPKKWNQYGMEVYGMSKACNILFTKELQRRFAKDGITSFAVHPGFVDTDLARNMTGIMKFATQQMGKLLARNLKDGAKTTLYTVVTDNLCGGGYFRDCTEAAPADFTLDETSAARLWEISEQLTGLNNLQEAQLVSPQ